MSVVSEIGKEMPVLEQVLRMTVNSAEHSSLNARQYFMVRIAALAATGMGASAWMTNLEAAAASGLTKEDVQGVLVAVAPVIGTARTLSAVRNALRGIGLETALIEAEEEQ